MSIERFRIKIMHTVLSSAIKKCSLIRFYTSFSIKDITRYILQLHPFFIHILHLYVLHVAYTAPLMCSLNTCI